MKKKILFVDDEVQTSLGLRNVLQNEYDFEVKFISIAQEVLPELSQIKYDAVILDIMLPFEKSYYTDNELKRIENGLATGMIILERIRIEFPKLPVLIYSAKNNIKIDAYTHYLRKPELVKAIAAELNELLKK
jgi:DNA-binding NarL/FixJ family response regulator